MGAQLLCKTMKFTLKAYEMWREGNGKLTGGNQLELDPKRALNQIRIRARLQVLIVGEWPASAAAGALAAPKGGCFSPLFLHR
jgi:hypothetical protein